MSCERSSALAEVEEEEEAGRGADVAGAGQTMTVEADLEIVAGVKEAGYAFQVTSASRMTHADL